MSFWSTISTLWSLSNEYTAAVAAANESFQKGESLAKVVKTFAAQTNNAIDDKAVNLMIEDLALAIGYINQASLVAGQAAAKIEAYAPMVLSTVEKGIKEAHKLAEQGSEQAESIRKFAVDVGVLATKLSTRLDSLLQDRPI